MKKFLVFLLLLSTLGYAQKVDNPRVVIRSCAKCTDVLYEARAIIVKGTFPATPEGRIALQAALLKGVYRLELANGAFVPAGTKPPRTPPSPPATTNPGTSTTTTPGTSTTTTPGTSTTTTPGTSTTTGANSYTALVEAEASTGQITSVSPYIFDDPAASGGKLYCCFSVSADYLNYSLTNVPTQGNYKIELRYQTNTGASAAGTISANGSSQSIAMDGLGGGKAVVQVTLPLTAGTNTVRVAGASGVFIQDRIKVWSVGGSTGGTTTTPPSSTTTSPGSTTTSPGSTTTSPGSTTTAPSTTFATAAIASGSSGIQLIIDTSAKTARVVGRMPSGSLFGVRLLRNDVEIGSLDQVSGPQYNVSFSNISGAGTYKVRCYEIGNDPNTLLSPILTISSQ